VLVRNNSNGNFLGGNELNVVLLGCQRLRPGMFEISGTCLEMYYYVGVWLESIFYPMVIGLGV